LLDFKPKDRPKVAWSAIKLREAQLNPAAGVSEQRRRICPGLTDFAVWVRNFMSRIASSSVPLMAATGTMKARVRPLARGSCGGC
jgi:hypothetical protein